MKNWVCFYVQFETVSEEKVNAKVTRFPFFQQHIRRQFVNIKPPSASIKKNEPHGESEIRMSDTQQAAQGLAHNPSL